MIKLKDLLTEAPKPKKGDTILDWGDEGKIHKISGPYAYVKFSSTGASSFSPVVMRELVPDKSRKGVWRFRDQVDIERERSESKLDEYDRDYKDEYKKFQSSPKMRRYRSSLNKYNRKKGTYGNNDGKDASHSGGKITGFEAQSKNRGRREKSRISGRKK